MTQMARTDFSPSRHDSSHAPCNILYFGPMLIGCRLVLSYATIRCNDQLSSSDPSCLTATPRNCPWWTRPSFSRTPRARKSAATACSARGPRSASGAPLSAASSVRFIVVLPPPRLHPRRAVHLQAEHHVVSFFSGLLFTWGLCLIPRPHPRALAAAHSYIEACGLSIPLRSPLVTPRLALLRIPYISGHLLSARSLRFTPIGCPVARGLLIQRGEI